MYNTCIKDLICLTKDLCFFLGLCTHVLLLIEFNCLNKVFQCPLERPVQTFGMSSHWVMLERHWSAAGDCLTWHSHSTAGMTSLHFDSRTSSQSCSQICTHTHTSIKTPSQLQRQACWSGSGQRLFFLSDITTECKNASSDQLIVLQLLSTNGTCSTD